MTATAKKSVLCDLVSRHSNFNFDEYISTTPSDEYDTWNGYCLPMEYDNAAEEYQSIRNSCAIFDASPMKKYRFRGADAGQFLDSIFTAPVSHLPAMRAAYGLICTEQGLLLDDGIVNKYATDDYLLLISEMDLDDYFAQVNDFENLTISEETALSAGIAIQGPKSCGVLRQFGFEGVEDLQPFDLKLYDLGGHEIMLGRLGFTGDLGYEIWFSPDAIDAVEKALSHAEKSLAIKIPGYALTALQVCRIEAGMIVPGWDTEGEFTNANNERTPFELTLGWNVKLNGAQDFVGKTALIGHKARGPRFKMKGFNMSALCSPKEGQALFAKVDGESVQVGALPSIVWHAGEKQWIGFASLQAVYGDLKETYIIDDGNRVNCQIRTLPLINLERRSEVPAAL